MTEPDFETLRAVRNASIKKHVEKMAEELGVEPGKIRFSFDLNGCYCACGDDPRGPCEHKWDGPDWESDDGCACSVTCSRCGMTAMSHDMRVLP